MKTIFVSGIMGLFLTLTTLAHPGIGIVSNSKGEIFYTDLKRIWKISSDGKSKTIVVPNVHTHELYMDAHDNLYGEHLWYEGETTDKWGHYVWKYGAEGKFTKIKPTTEGFLQNYSFVRDAAGNMYRLISSKNGSDWMKISPDQKVEWLATVPTKDVRWQFCRKDGTFYYVDDNDLCKMVDRKAVIVTQDLDGVKGEEPKRKPNNSIFGMWDDAGGNIYVAVTGKKNVKKIAPDGRVSTVYQTPGTWMPTGGIVDKKGGLWVLETNAINDVRVVKL
ncbi:hypothetical protein [Runella sp.]|uniref:hypothetical protein n=1 Tax=Runella sp. TaxID=1960881 RepID=UPI003D0D64DC